MPQQITKQKLLKRKMGDHKSDNSGSGSGWTTKYQRTVYFSGCNHKSNSYVQYLELGSFYYCETCAKWRKISEIAY